MRIFASEIEKLGHQVLCFTLDHPENDQGLDKMIPKLVQGQSFERYEYPLRDEFCLDMQLKSICNLLKIETASIDTEHFLNRESFSEIFQIIFSPIDVVNLIAFGSPSAVI